VGDGAPPHPAPLPVSGDVLDSGPLA